MVPGHGPDGRRWQTESRLTYSQHHQPAEEEEEELEEGEEAEDAEDSDDAEDAEEASEEAAEEGWEDAGGRWGADVPHGWEMGEEEES